MARRREFRGGNDDRRNNDDRRKGYDMRQRLEKKKGAVSFFISRIPEKWNSKEFLSEMKKKGPVMEAFIISKRDKHGLRFGFARFELGIDVEALTTVLGQMVVDGVRLFAKVARFDRNGVDTMSPQPQIHQRTQEWQSIGGTGGRRTVNISFVEVVKGKETTIGDNQKDTGNVSDNPGNPKSKSDNDTHRRETGDSEVSTPGHTKEFLDNQNSLRALENQLPLESLKIQEEPDNQLKQQASEDQQTSGNQNTQEEPVKPWFCINSDQVEDPLTKLESSYVAEVKSLQALNCIRNIIAGEGYGNDTVNYLGGLWILLTFNSEREETKFMNDDAIKSWLSSIEKWGKSFRTKDRIVNLDIEGLPIHVYSTNTLTRIARMYGEVLNTDEGNLGGGDLSRGMVCILTTIQELIWVTIPIQLDDDVIEVRIREFPYFPWEDWKKEQHREKNKNLNDHEEGEKEGENNEEDVEESDNESGSEEDSGDDIYEESASFLEDGDPLDDLEDTIESKLQGDGDKDEEDLHTPSAAKVLSSHNLEIHKESFGRLFRQETKNQQEGESMESVERGAESSTMLPCKKNQTDGGGGNLVHSQTREDPTQKKDELKNQGINLIHVTEGEGSGGNQSQVENYNHSAPPHSNTNSNDCRSNIKIRGTKVKENTGVYQVQVTEGEGPGVNQVQGENNNHADPTHSNTDRNDSRREGEVVGIISSIGESNNPKKRIELRQPRMEPIEGEGAGADQSTGTMLGGVKWASKEDSRKNRTQEESGGNFNALIDKNGSAVNQGEKNDQEREVQATLSGGFLSSSKEVQTMLTGGIISSTKEDSRKNKTQEASEESGVKQSQKGQFGSTAASSYNQHTEGEDSGVNQSQKGQNGSAAVPSYNQHIGGEESGVKQSLKGQTGSTAAPSYNQYIEGEESGFKQTQKGQNGYTAAPPSYSVTGGNHSRNEEISSNTANPKRVKAAPEMGKKKRRTRFVDKNSSPIRTRQSLQKIKDEGSKSSKDMDGIPLSLESSIRALRKKDREVKGLRIQYPERVLVPIPSGDVDNDSDEIRIGKACGFFKSVKNAESKKGLDYWV